MHPIMQAEGVKSEPAIGQQFTMHPVGYPRNYSVRFFICGPFAWGAPFLGFVAVASLLYVGGGVVYGKKAQGRADPTSALAPHPHYQEWLAVAELCRDGVAFAKSQTLGGGPGPGGVGRGRDRLLPQSESTGGKDSKKSKEKGSSKHKRSTKG